MANHLTLEERDRIAQLRFHGADQKEIAEAVGRSPSTISRELRRNRTDDEYFAAQAQREAERRRQERPLVRKMDDPEINETVRAGLRRRTNRERSWRKTVPRPRRDRRTKGKSCSLLASPCHFSIEMSHPRSTMCSQARRVDRRPSVPIWESPLRFGFVVRGHGLLPLAVQEAEYHGSLTQIGGMGEGRPGK